MNGSFDSLELIRRWWKVGVIIFSLGGMAYATDARLSRHESGASEMVEVSKETCYAIHRHANLDPRSCYDSSKRGPK